MVKRKDLVCVGDKDYTERQGEYMLCLDCGNAMGGTQGDFFSIGMNYIIYCSECRSENLALAKDVKNTIILKK
ncbi:unnamed protein product [marine sediment metagenome]|uniref:Uncharacterized protein n=1 Tax=marine sediment metagenome TaxID=412755 RepID=X1FRA4_9ZZZZ